MVLKVKVKGHREDVAVVGSLPSATPGEWLTAEGRWERNREFGMQFRAELLKSRSAPVSSAPRRWPNSRTRSSVRVIYIATRLLSITYFMI